MPTLVKRICMPAMILAPAILIFSPPFAGAQEAAPPEQKSQPQGPAKQAEQPPAKEAEQPPVPDAQDLLMPAPVPDEKLVPTLPTIPVRRDRPAFNYQMVNTALLPRDKEGIWVLDFSFKPLRIRSVEVGGVRKPVHYLYYKVVNRTGKPRMFVPQFIMVNEEGKRIEDQVIPAAIPLIQAREDPTVPVLGAVNIMGIMPPSSKEGVDDAVYGAAVWDKWDPKADRYSIYVRGLSDGYKEIPGANGGKPTIKYKTLRIDFIRRGDERNLNEKEIEFSDPIYEWIYW